MNVGKRFGGTKHNCTLLQNSESCLPKLAPNASKIKKYLRKFKKYLMVSETDCNSKFFFRSRAQIKLERKRHFKTTKWYIIHPFSTFNVVHQTIMCIIWFITFVKVPFIVAFSDKFHRNNHLLMIFNMIMKLILLYNIIICFITGYYKVQTKEVILDRKRIAKRYISTYFLFDLVGILPNHLASLFIGPQEYTIDEHAHTHYIYNTKLSLFCDSFQLLHLARLKCAFRYFRWITQKYEVSESAHVITSLILLSLCIIHWWACVTYLIPKIIYLWDDEELVNLSWTVAANISINSNAKLSTIYSECYLVTVCHFYGAGLGWHETKLDSERIMFTFILLSGFYFNCYMLVILLRMVPAGSSSASKYEEQVYQLKEYMQKKKLPNHIRHRLLLFYDNRFQKHYFEEHAILNTLPDHLRYEIFLQSCKGLVQGVSLFQGLSKTTVGSIVACLKHEVFLPNDIIFKAHTPAKFMYFISFGSVYLSLPSGKEICHLEDGDYFGEISLLAEGAHDLTIKNVIALEITEVFKLAKNDLQRCVTEDEEFSQLFRKIAQQKFANIEMLRRVAETNDAARHDIFRELRDEKILEHQRRKRR